MAHPVLEEAVHEIGSGVISRRCGRVFGFVIRVRLAIFQDSFQYAKMTKSHNPVPGE
jgi:hypothetical protein